MKMLFRVDPHGSQGVYDADDGSQHSQRNRLHCIKDDQGRFVNMTGEELTSLANQWLSRCKNAAAAKKSKASPILSASSPASNILPMGSNQ